MLELSASATPLSSRPNKKNPPPNTMANTFVSRPFVIGACIALRRFDYDGPDRTEARKARIHRLR